MKRITLNHVFHQSSLQYSDKKCVIRAAKCSRTSITYSQMLKLVKECVAILQDCDVDSHRSRFIALVGDEIYIETIALLIAVMDTGNAFVFLNSSSSRLNEILDRLKVQHVISENTCSQLPSVKLIKSFHIFENNFDVWKRNCECDGDNLHEFAFAVMSSGSTGVPKIIKVLHKSIITNILDLKKIYQMGPEDVIYLTTPLTFDPSIVDIFTAFHAGAAIMLPSQEMKFDENFLTGVFTGCGDCATVWYTTPSIFMKFMPNLEQINLKILILGGEQFPKLDLRMWPFLGNIKVYNIYGITEVSCWASIHLVDDFTKPVPLGKLLSNTRFDIRADGELFIGSEMRKCVVDDDFHLLSEAVLFRPTGDLVKVINGQYYFIGRKDRRIKLYGNIVDLSEIEASVMRNSTVKCCYCMFIEEDAKIIALVESNRTNLDVNEIEKALRNDLPPVMIPSRIFLEKIPINEHGKICVTSCRELYEKLNTTATDLATEFRNLWEKYTNGKINETLGFIHSGGNSILALQFSTALSELYEVPTDFIIYLLSNKNFTECFDLIKNKIVLKINKPKSFVSIEMKRSIADEKSPYAKKLKLSFGEVLQVKGKNYPGDFQSTVSIEKSHLEVNIIWKHDLKKCVDASPTLIVYESNIVAVCGSHSGLLVMVDVPSGEVILEISLPDRIESSAAVSNCGKFLFIGCYDKKLYCVDILQKCIRWGFETGDIVKSTPVVRLDRIYFGSYDHYFYCLSEDGSLIWKTDIDGTSIYATPVVSESIVVATLSGTVAILNFNGDITYRTSYGKPFFANPFELPSIRKFIVIDVTGVMRLLDMNTGQQIWEHSIDGNVFSSISGINYTSNRITFGCYDRNVYCIDVSDERASLVWKKELEETIYSTPFAFGKSSASDFNRYVVVITTTGNFYVIDSTSGNQLSNYRISGPVFSSPVVHEGYIVVGCRDNFLYCFKISYR